MMNEKDIRNMDVENGNDEDLYYGVGAFIWEVVKVFFWALVIIVPIRVFLFQPFFVQGASMEPNFHNGDYLIVNELGYKKTDVGTDDTKVFTVDTFRDFERGDVVIFRYPLKPTEFFIKRIVGLPGEKISIENGRVLIYNNEHPEGFYLDESSYLSTNVQTSGATTRHLGQDEYFVMGDNRSASHDSRAWGPIRKSDVIGRAFLRAWPVHKAGLF